MRAARRVYKNFDPRAKIIREVAEEVFQIQGRDPLIDVAVELEKRARSDDYFVKRNLYPNVDFYSGESSLLAALRNALQPLLPALLQGSSGSLPVRQCWACQPAAHSLVLCLASDAPVNRAQGTVSRSAMLGTPQGWCTGRWASRRSSSPSCSPSRV